MFILIIKLKHGALIGEFADGLAIRPAGLRLHVRGRTGAHCVGGSLPDAL